MTTYDLIEDVRYFTTKASLPRELWAQVDEVANSHDLTTAEVLGVIDQTGFDYAEEVLDNFSERCEGVWPSVEAWAVDIVALDLEGRGLDTDEWPFYLLPNIDYEGVIYSTLRHDYSFYEVASGYLVMRDY